MKAKISITLLLLATLAVTGCKHERITNDEMWTDTIEHHDSSYSSVVMRYYVFTHHDNHLDEDILNHSFHSFDTRGIEEDITIDSWFVNRNGVLYSSSVPLSAKVESKDGTYRDNEFYNKKDLKEYTSKEPMGEWKKINEDTAYLIYYASDTKEIFIRHR